MSVTFPYISLEHYRGSTNIKRLILFYVTLFHPPSVGALGIGSVTISAKPNFISAIHKIMGYTLLLVVFIIFICQSHHIGY